MPSPGRGFDLEVEGQINVADMRAVLHAARAMEKTLYTNLRKGLREAGEIAARDIRATVQKPTYGGGRTIRTSRLPRGTIRKALARGTKVSIRAGAKSQGIRIQTKRRALPAGHEGMVYLYRRSTWRHPVFGNRDVWRQQRGREYFYGPMARNRPQVTRAAVEALEITVGELWERGGSF